MGKLLVLPADARLDWRVIARYKQSSLFGLIISNEGKKYNTDTWAKRTGCKSLVGFIREAYLSGSSITTIIISFLIGTGFQFNVDFSVSYWLEKGARKEQLLVGMGAYGRGFRLQDPAQNGLYAPAVGGIDPGYYTRCPCYKTFFLSF